MSQEIRSRASTAVSQRPSSGGADSVVIEIEDDPMPRKLVMCTPCLMNMASTPKSSCTVGAPGSHCKECIKRKHPHEENEEPESCIQFDVMRFPESWGAISAARHRLVTAMDAAATANDNGTPGLFMGEAEKKAEEIEQLRVHLHEHCVVLTSFAKYSVKDRMRMGQRYQQLEQHLQHVREEVDNANNEKRRATAAHKREIKHLEDNIRGRDKRIAQLGNAIASMAKPADAIGKYIRGINKTVMDAGVKDSEISQDIDDIE